jgi:hypothetical protein
VQKAESGDTIGSCTIQCALLHLHRSVNSQLLTNHLLLYSPDLVQCDICSSRDSRFDSNSIVLSVKEIQHDTAAGLAAVLQKDFRGASSNGRTVVASVYLPVRFQTYLFGK